MANSIVRTGRTEADFARALQATQAGVDATGGQYLAESHYSSWPNGAASDMQVAARSARLASEIRAAWRSEFVEPVQCATMLAALRSDRSLLLTLKSETYRSGFAWLTPEREAAMETALSAIGAFIDDISLRDLDSAVYSHPAVPSAAHENVHLQHLTRYVSDTFSFSR